MFVSSVPSRKRQSYAPASAESNPPAIHVLPLEGGTVLLSTVESQGRQLLALLYLGVLQEYKATFTEAFVTIYVLAGNLDGEGDWERADLTRGPDLSNFESICFTHVRPISVRPFRSH